jgi:hypothetical protein
MTQNDQLPKLANTNLWKVRQEILRKRWEQDIIRQVLAIRNELTEKRLKIAKNGRSVATMPET